MQFLSENRLSICQIFICFSFLNWIWTDFRFSTHPVHWQQGHAPIINTPPCVTSVHWQQGHHRDHIQTVQTCHDSLQVSAVQGLAPSYLADDVSWPRLLPVDDICSLPTPWTGLVRRTGLSSAPETLWFGRSHLEQSLPAALRQSSCSVQTFGTVYQQLWDSLPARFRHLDEN